MSSNLYKYNEQYKPFIFPEFVQIAKEHDNDTWSEDEAQLGEDVKQWKYDLNEEEKNLITHILRLFTQSDVAVGQSYIDNLLPRFKNNEVRMMLLSFAGRECVHQRAYALLNDTLGLPDSEYHAFLEYAEMKDKWEFMNQSSDYTNRTEDGISLAKMAFMEGVSLFSSFAMLLNFSRFGKMKGMCEITEWSIRDEALLPGTNVVTDCGLKPIEEITLNDMVLQFDMKTKELSFVHPEKTQRVVRTEGYCFQGPGFSQTVSPNHRMIYEQNGEIKECLAKDFVPAEDKFFLVLEDKLGGTTESNKYELKDGKEVTLKRIKSTEVTKTKIDFGDKQDFYCLGVPGKAFVIEDDECLSITGNTAHVAGNVALFHRFCEENPHLIDDAFKKRVYDLAREVVALEDKFIDKAFELGDVEGLTAELVKKYIRYIADRRLIQLGFKGNWRIKEIPNGMEWLSWVVADNVHANFFESRVTNYSAVNYSGSDDDFFSMLNEEKEDERED